MAKIRYQKIRAEESLSIEFDGGRNTPEKFLATTRAFLDLVKEVASQVSGDEKAIELDVSVYPASIGIRVVPYVRSDIHLPSPIECVVIAGIKLLEGNGDQIPKYFTKKALSDAAILSRNVHSGKMKLIGSSKDFVPLSSQTNATVERLLRPKYSAHGSVEGVLRGIYADDDSTLKFEVRDEVNDDWVLCIASPNWEHQLIENWKKRVSVIGIVNYDRDGFPISINVENVMELPGFESLPPVETYRGLFVS
jgi:hypothetical protein